MRIVHTADWHLCDRLGRIDRTADLRARVERVAALCEGHAADVLVIAGDLFYERADATDIAAALGHVHEAFTPFFKRGGTILAVTGNHDDDGKIDLVRRGLFRASPLPRGGVFARGRMYLQNGLAFGRFEAVAGDAAQFVLVPYPRAARYELPDGYRTREEEHRLLQTKLAEWMTQTLSNPKFDPHLPSVLVAHLHVRGANVNNSLFRISDADDVLIDAAVLQTGWAYAALGHIHLPQAVGDVETVRYPGPLDRLDFGEKTDSRGVLVFDLGPAGVTAAPQWLPLEPTPFLDVTVADPDTDLPALAEKYPDHDTAIVRITVEKDGEKVSRDEIGRRLRALFPRLHQLRFPETTPAGEVTSSASGTSGVDKPFAERVRAYLAESLIDDPDREAVIALADAFLDAEAKEATP
jgi:DNA repair protein SbcD/Mre11